MWSPSEKLHHEGIRLRRWRPVDAEVIARVVDESRDHLAPWMTFVADGYGQEDAVHFLEHCENDWKSGIAFQYAILAADGAVAGSAGLMARIDDGGLEIGYWLHPAHTGQGMATRAAAALTAEAFRIGADHVEITHDLANDPSRAIPERLGFTEVGKRVPQRDIMPAEVGTDVIWRLCNEAAG